MRVCRRSIVSWLSIATFTFRHGIARAARPPLIGVLAPSTLAKERVTLAPFFQRMAELGWVEPATVSYLWRTADDDLSVLPRLAQELVAKRPDLIYAPPAPSAVAARAATHTIPIVFATGTDPVGLGLVASLAKPGGNVTGAISVADSLAPKLAQLLLQVKPTMRAIGLVGAPADPRWSADQQALAAIAPALGLRIVPAPADDARGFEAAVARIASAGGEALVTATTLVFNQRERLLEAANARHLPVAGHRGEMADAGALLAYSPPLWRQIQRSADIVDKILHGENPATIPVEQPIEFELVLNLRSARAFNLAFPPALVTRADRVID
jgi:putative ABC transport system substrate-binding protein